MRTPHRIPLQRRLISALILLTFGLNSIFPTPVLAQNISLPTMLSTGIVFQPVMLKGLSINPQNPLEFDFFVDPAELKLSKEDFNEEATKLIKYFLASLTVPEKDMWVNLSPYEKNRIIPEQFGVTEMGRDLLAQDYILKQLTASLMYPESELGKGFWNKVHKKVQEKYGKTDIPVDTFNKVWIVPAKAVVYEHNGSAFVVENKLKVMMEEDYLARSSESGVRSSELPTPNSEFAQIITEIILPEIEKEVNTSKHFAPLRQIANAMVLATWYKKRLKDSLLGQVYVDRNKTKGIDIEDKEAKQKIYEQYLETFKKGVYNYIKEEYDPATQEMIQRKYVSGGANMDYGPKTDVVTDMAMLTTDQWDSLRRKLQTVKTAMVEMGPNSKADVDQAMLTPSDLVGGKLNLQYLERMRQIVNPRGTDRIKTALYLGAGADISSVLLATDSDNIIMVNDGIFYAEGFSVDTTKRLNAVDTYLKIKRSHGWALGVELNKPGLAWVFLKKELDVLGAKNISEKPREIKPNVFEIVFEWNGRPRKIVYVSQAEGTESQNYEQFITEAGGLDYFFLKAGEYTRSEGALRLTEETVSFLNPSGYVIVDDKKAVPQSKTIWGLLEVQEDARLNDLQTEGATFGYTSNIRGAVIYQKREAPDAAMLGSRETPRWPGTRPVKNTKFNRAIRERYVPAFKEALSKLPADSAEFTAVFDRLRHDLSLPSDVFKKIEDEFAAKQPEEKWTLENWGDFAKRAFFELNFKLAEKGWLLDIDRLEGEQHLRLTVADVVQYDIVTIDNKPVITAEINDHKSADVLQGTFLGVFDAAYREPAYILYRSDFFRNEQAVAQFAQAANHALFQQYYPDAAKILALINSIPIPEQLKIYTDLVRDEEWTHYFDRMRIDAARAKNPSMNLGEIIDVIFEDQNDSLSTVIKKNILDEVKEFKTKEQEEKAIQVTLETKASIRKILNAPDVNYFTYTVICLIITLNLLEMPGPSLPQEIASQIVLYHLDGMALKANDGIKENAQGKPMLNNLAAYGMAQYWRDIQDLKNRKPPADAAMLSDNLPHSFEAERIAGNIIRNNLANFPRMSNGLWEQLQAQLRDILLAGIERNYHEELHSLTLDDFTYIGAKLNEAWKQDHPSESLFPYFSMAIDHFMRENDNFYEFRDRLDAFTKGGTREERAQAIWVRGLMQATHLRYAGVHAEYSKGWSLDLMDNEDLVKVVRELIPLMVRWKSESPESWNAPLPVSSEYRGEGLEITHGDLMTWGLIVMLDPILHDIDHYFTSPNYHERTRRLAAEKGWASGRDSKIYYMTRMLSGLEGATDDEVSVLLEEAFRDLKDKPVYAQLRSPLRTFTGNWKLIMPKFLGAAPMPLPEAFFIVLPREKISPYFQRDVDPESVSPEYTGLADIDSIDIIFPKHTGQGYSHGNGAHNSPFNRLDAVADAKLLAPYVEIFETILDGKLKPVAEVVRELAATEGAQIAPQAVDAAMLGQSTAPSARAKDAADRLVKYLAPTLPSRKNAAAAGPGTYRFLKSMIEYLISQNPDVAQMLHQMVDSDPGSLTLDELAYVGQRLNELWKESTSESIFPYMALFIEQVAIRETEDGATNFLKIHERLDALMRNGSPEDRSLGLWVKGLQVVLHLRRHGIHAEYTKPGHLELADNELLIRTVQELIPLIIKWKAESPDRLAQKIAPEAGFSGEQLELTYQDLMDWGLAMMLDPIIHDHRYTITDGTNHFVKETREFLDGKKWEGDASIREYMSRMLGEIEGVSDEEVVGLVASAFENVRNKFSGSLRTPFKAVSFHYEVGVSMLINHSVAVPVAKPFVAILNPDEVFRQAKKSGSLDEDALRLLDAELFYTGKFSNNGSPYNALVGAENVAEEKFIEVYERTFDSILGGRFKAAARALEAFVPVDAAMLGDRRDNELTLYGKASNLMRDLRIIIRLYDLEEEFDKRENQSQKILLIGVGRGIAAMEMAIRYPAWQIVAVNKETELWDEAVLREYLLRKYSPQTIDEARKRIVLRVADLDSPEGRTPFFGENFDMVVFEGTVLDYFKDKIRAVEDFYNETLNVNGLFAFDNASIAEDVDGLLEGMQGILGAVFPGLKSSTAGPWYHIVTKGNDKKVSIPVKLKRWDKTFIGRAERITAYYEIDRDRTQDLSADAAMLGKGVVADKRALNAILGKKYSFPNARRITLVLKTPGGTGLGNAGGIEVLAKNIIRQFEGMQLTVAFSHEEQDLYDVLRSRLPKSVAMLQYDRLPDYSNDDYSLPSQTTVPDRSLRNRYDKIPSTDIVIYYGQEKPHLQYVSLDDIPARLAIHIPIYGSTADGPLINEGKNRQGKRTRHILIQPGEFSKSNAGLFLNRFITEESLRIESLSEADILNERKALAAKLGKDLTAEDLQGVWAFAYVQDADVFSQYIKQLENWARNTGQHIVLFFVQGKELRGGWDNSYLKVASNAVVERKGVKHFGLPLSFDQKDLYNQVLLLSGALVGKKGQRKLGVFPNLVTGDQSLGEALAGRKLFIHDEWMAARHKGSAFLTALFLGPLKNFAEKYDLVTEIEGKDVPSEKRVDWAKLFQVIAKEGPEVIQLDYEAALNDLLSDHNLIDEIARVVKENLPDAAMLGEFKSWEEVPGMPILNRTRGDGKKTAFYISGKDIKKKDAFSSIIQNVMPDDFKNVKAYRQAGSGPIAEISLDPEEKKMFEEIENFLREYAQREGIAFYQLVFLPSGETHIEGLIRTGATDRPYRLKPAVFIRHMSAPNLIEVFHYDELMGTLGEDIPATDTAMLGETENVGGINLDPELWDLQIKRDGNGIPLPLIQQPLQQINIEGFLPVILNITPATNLPLLLGLPATDEVPPIELSRNPDPAAQPKNRIKELVAQAR